jgi:N-acetylglucosaminyldiphosphoundecaprenol N-acetyl-beta-D-mannosaminyltransferase
VDSTISPTELTTSAPPQQEPVTPAFERRRVLAAAVDVASPQEIVRYLTERAQERKGCSVVGISAPYATAMADDPALREAFLAADVLVPDGKGFSWGARMLGVPCGERIAMPDLCERLLDAANARRWKVFIYGATEKVNNAACANLARRFPNVMVAGQHGYGQTPETEDALIERLHAEQFNLLLVARPSPDKERFLARGCSRAGVVGLAVGGYVDILGGRTRRAPRAVQAIGMEWLYRVVQEPRRLWKRVGWANMRFAAAVLWAHLRGPMRRPWWSNPAIHAALIVLAVSAAYVPSINAPYHFDDPEYILDNPTIRSFDALSQIKVLSFRKLWWLSNAICYRASELWGNHMGTRPDPRIFRAWNIGCHLIAALALYGLLRRVLRASGHIAADSKQSAGTAYDLVPFAGAAIFAAHPLCTESVTYISGRDNSQGGMFYLLGLYAAAIAFGRMSAERAGTSLFNPQSAIRNPHSPSAPASCLLPPAYSPFWPVWLWPMVWAIGLGACAMLTKESHITFFPAVVLLYLCFYRGAQSGTVSYGFMAGLMGALAAFCAGSIGRREGYLAVASELGLVLLVAGTAFGAPSENPSPVRRFWQQRLTTTWAFVLAIVGFAAMSILAFPYVYERTLVALSGQAGSNWVRSLCTQAYALPWLLLRAVAPYGLNIDHDFPTIVSPGEQRALIWGALAFIYAAATLWQFWRARAIRHVAVAVGVSASIFAAVCVYSTLTLPSLPASLFFGPAEPALDVALKTALFAFTFACCWRLPLGWSTPVLAIAGVGLAFMFPHGADMRVVYGAAILLTLVIFGALAIWKRWLSGFAVLMSLLVIAPTNSVIERGDVVSERNFYLVAAGGACLLAWLAAALTTWLAESTSPSEAGQPAPLARMREAGLWTGVLASCVAMPFVSLTVQRNLEWCDAYRLWDSARKRSPNKLRVNYNFGVAAYAKKRYDEADMAFRNVIEIGDEMRERKQFRPDEGVQIKCFHMAYNNYANLVIRRSLVNGKNIDPNALRMADDIFQRGMERAGYDPELTCGYAQFLMQLGRTTDAVPKLQQSMNLHPWAEQICLPLGMAYLEIGHLELAAQYLQRAAQAKEHHTLGVDLDVPAQQRSIAEALYGLSKLLQKDKAGARDALRRSLELHPTGLSNMLGGSLKAQNSRLKMINPDPPDLLAMQLSVTRRDLLETIEGAIDDLVKARAGQDTTLWRMLRGMIDTELQRRAALQEKRRTFGFFDDPDSFDAPDAATPKDGKK